VPEPCPPIIVVTPLASVLDLLRADEMDGVSIPPAVTMQPSAAITSVAAPMTSPGVMPR
jgi:hypothetical protein